MNKQIYIAKSENKLDVDVNIAIDIDIYREREILLNNLSGAHLCAPTFEHYHMIPCKQLHCWMVCIYSHL